MNIVERLVGDVTIIDLQGKIMIGEGDEALRDAVTKAIDSGKTKLVLNLAEVPYVDSAGLGELVRCYSTVNKKGGKLKLLNLTKKIQDLLAITKLLTVFETFDAEDEPSRVSLEVPGPKRPQSTLQARTRGVRRGFCCFCLGSRP
jgi:anti-sigma B factor antagonist